VNRSLGGHETRVNSASEEETPNVSIVSWSVWRALGVWAAWVFAVALALAATLVIALWKASPSGARGLHSDFAIAFTGTEIRRIVLLLLLPPIAFTLAWAWQRFGPR
jgi:hypothetical protein